MNSYLIAGVVILLIVVLLATNKKLVETLKNVYKIEELRADERVSFDQSLMLINTEYKLQDGFVPDVLEYKDTTVYMSRRMINAYAALSAAVNDKMGQKLYVSSDFRSEEEQEALYAEDPFTATIPGAS